MAAPVRADIMSQEMVDNWHEWDGNQWSFSSSAGVVSVVPRAARTITLSGFKNESMNKIYQESRDELIDGREIYLSSDGQHFIFWCQGETRWKGSATDFLPKIRKGKSFSFLGSPQGADILSPGLLKCWQEWFDNKWIYRPEAGVSHIGTVGGKQSDVRQKPHKRVLHNAGQPAKRSRTDVPAVVVRHAGQQPKRSSREQGLASTDSESSRYELATESEPENDGMLTPRSQHRSEVVETIFSRYDVDGDGHLCSSELRAFAEAAGFDGDDQEWADEYRQLLAVNSGGCTEEKGVHRVAFCRLISDVSGEGLYCTDEELLGILDWPKKGA